MAHLALSSEVPPPRHGHGARAAKRALLAAARPGAARRHQLSRRLQPRGKAGTTTTTTSATVAASPGHTCYGRFPEQQPVLGELVLAPSRASIAAVAPTLAQLPAASPPGSSSSAWRIDDAAVASSSRDHRAHLCAERDRRGGPCRLSGGASTPAARFAILRTSTLRSPPACPCVARAPSRAVPARPRAGSGPAGNSSGCLLASAPRSATSRCALGATTARRPFTSASLSLPA